MGRKLKPEEARARWQARAAAFGKIHGEGFRATMAAVWNLDRSELDRRVYMEAKPTKRSGNLRGYEIMRLLSDKSAVITNTATSVWKGVRTFYAHIVAKGTGPRRKGKKYYAWMLDPREPRPDSWEGWVEAVAQGRARLAHNLPALKPNNWRQAAVLFARQRGIRASYWRAANKKVHDQ